MKSLFQRQASWRSRSHDHQSGTRKTKSVPEDRWGTTVSRKTTKHDRPLSVPRSSSMQHLQHPPNHNHNHNHHTASTQLPLVVPPRRPRRASIADFAPPPMLPNHEDDTAAYHKMSDCTTRSTSTKPKKTKKKDLQSESSNNNNNNIPKKDPKAKKSFKVPTNNSVEKKQEKKKKKKKKSEKSTLESGSMKKTTTKPKGLKTKTKKKKTSKSVPSTQDEEQEHQHHQSWSAADRHTASMSLLLASPCPSYSSLPPLSPSASFTSLQSSSVVSVASHTTSTTWSTTSSATGTSLAGSTASSSSSSSGRFHLPGGGGMDHLHNHLHNETSSRKRVRTIRLDMLPPPKSILVHPDQHATTRHKNPHGPKSILKKAPKHVHFSSKDGTTTTLLSRPRAGLLVPPSSPLEELTPAEQDQFMFWTTAELAAIQQRTNRLVQSVLEQEPPSPQESSASGRSRSRQNPPLPQVVSCLQQCFEEPSSSTASGTHHHAMSPEKAMQTFFFCQVPEPITTTVAREPLETHDNNDKDKDPHHDTAKQQQPAKGDMDEDKNSEDWEWTTLRGLERYLLPTALREGRRYQTIQSVLELQRVISNEMRHQEQERPEQQQPSRPGTTTRPTNRDSLYQDDDDDDDRKEHSQDKRHQTASESQTAAGDNEVWTLSRLEQALRNQSCRTSRAAQRVARLLAKGDAAIVGARRNRPTTTGSSSSSQPVSSSSSTASSSRPGSS